MKVNFAASRLKREKAAARQDKAPAPAVNRCQHRAGVAGEVLADLVFDLAVGLVEGDDRAAGAFEIGDIRKRPQRRAFGIAADLDNQEVPLDARRAADPKEILHEMEIDARV